MIFEIFGLKDLGVTEKIPETGTSLKENALIKAKYVFAKTGLNCFSDDSGVEIEALNGRERLNFPVESMIKV